MPIIRGTCSDSGKPIADIVLAPIISAVGAVGGIPSPASFDMTPLKALIDTGADGTSISNVVASKLNLQMMGKRDVVGVGGLSRRRTWGVFVGFLFSESADFEGDNHLAKSVFAVAEPQLAIEIPANTWFDVIIGRDIITLYDFRMKKGGNWELDLSA